MSQDKEPKKPRQNPPWEDVDIDDVDMPATVTKMIEAWAKHAPNKKFAGMTLDDFRKAMQPMLDAHGEVEMLEREMKRLLASIGEADASDSAIH